MTDHVYGRITGDAGLGGIAALGDLVLFREVTTMAVESISRDETVPVLVVQMHGRLNKSDDTLTAAFVLAAADAGKIARQLLDHCRELPDGTADFEAGFSGLLD